MFLPRQLSCYCNVVGILVYKIKCILIFLLSLDLSSRLLFFHLYLFVLHSFLKAQWIWIKELSKILNFIKNCHSTNLSVPSCALLQIKKALLKTIVSLACRGNAEDGSDFVEFLVRHCCPNPNNSVSWPINSSIY